jgi:hypothetical protein
MPKRKQCEISKPERKVSGTTWFFTGRIRAGKSR